MKIDIEKLKVEIKNMCRELYRTKSYSDYIVKIQSLLVLIDLYSNLTGELFEAEVPFINKYAIKLQNTRSYMDEILDEYFDNQREHNKLSGKIISTFNRSGFKIMGLEESSRRLPFSYQIELINDFLNDLNPDIQKQFNYMHMQGLIDTTEKEIITNATYFDHFNSRPYILVDKLENIYDIDILMHELGHAYSLKKLENRSKTQSINFTRHYYEMFSMYMELCFQDFLKKNHILERDTILIENAYYEYMYGYFLSLKECGKLVDDDTLRADDMEYINDAFIYSYGHYIAMLLHDNKDKEGVNEALDDFLSYQGMLSYDDQLKIFGLDRDRLKDTKVLKKRLQIHNKDLEKHIQF